MSSKFQGMVKLTRELFEIEVDGMLGKMETQMESISL